MSALQINTAEDVYQFGERLKSECQKAGAMELFGQLDEALHLGSSGLEILGAIRQTIMDDRAAIERLLGPAGTGEAKQVVAFVDMAFGR
jgi:hypothetical protein